MQKRFAENRSHALQEGVWSDFETIILQEIYNVQNTSSFQLPCVIFQELYMFGAITRKCYF